MIDEGIDLRSPLAWCRADARNKRGNTVLDEMLRRGSDDRANALRAYGAKTARA